MADMNNFDEIQDSFNYIAEALDSMRAQNAMNSGNVDKLVANINSKLESLAGDETSELTKVFLVELKRSFDERQDFVSSKFSEIEHLFKDLSNKAETQLKGSEIKELFEIIATNLGVFSKDISAQKGLVSEISLRIDEIQKDESQKKEILKNISSLKHEMEKFGNGFESIIINLNDNFTQLSTVLNKLDSKDALDGLKKDIENIFLSSNAILSTMQVIDRKNRDLEAIINTFITKEDFNVERTQVADLIAQNIQLTDYIKNLPTQVNFGTLTEKIDTSIGVINALKNMLGETSKQNQQMLTAQLDNLETKILNISTEEEFIGFRKELAAFAQDVMENTNLIRADLADTNEGLRSLYEFLNTMDIKNSFLNFTEITKNSEKRMSDKFDTSLSKILEDGLKNQKTTKSNIEAGVSDVVEKLEFVKEELVENSQNNLSGILDKIQAVITNITSAKKEILIEDSAKMDALDGKFQNIKEDVANTGNFVINSSRENLSNLLSNLEKIFNEILAVKQNVGDTSNKTSQESSQKFNEIDERIKEIKDELNQNSKESFENLLSIVDDFSLSLTDTKESLEQDYDGKSTEIKQIIEGLSLKLTSLQEVLTKGYEVNFAEIKDLVESLTSITQSAKASLEQNSTFGFSGLSANLEELSQDLKSVEDNLENKSQSSLEKITSLFDVLSGEFDGYKSFLSESVQASFESVSLYFQSLSQKIEETKVSLDEKLNSKFSQVHDSISSLPETIKQNQEVFEEEKRTLIEENSNSIRNLSDKIQQLILGIMSKDNPFKEEVFYQLSEVKTVLETIKVDFDKATFELDENVNSQVRDSIENAEKLIAQYSERYNSSFINLQNKINSYLESVKEISQESDLKLEGSLRETFEIKAEVKALMERVLELKDDNSVSVMAEDMSQRFDSILIDISQLEENFATKNSDSLQSVLFNLEEKFESVSKEIREYKNATSSIPIEILAELEEKTEVLKAQVNLVATDIINVVSSRAGEIITRLVSLTGNIEKVSDVDFEDAFADIKSRLDSSNFLITSAIKQDFEKGNIEQIERISQDFEKVDEKLSKILVKVSSDNTKEISELKSILTEKVDNITSINTILETVLNELDRINVYSSETQDAINNARSELLEKINTVEDVLIQSQEDTREIINAKSAELQNRATLTVLDKIFQSAEDTKTVISADVYQVKSETQNAINEVKSGISNLSFDVSSSVHSTNLETKEEILEKISAFENSLIQSQEDNKYALVDEINKVQEEAKEFISEQLDISSEEIQKTITSKIVEDQENFKNNILNEITEFSEKTKASTLYGVRESVSNISSNINSLTENVVSSAKAELSEQIDSSISQIAEKQAENSELLGTVVESQERAKGLIGQVVQKQQQTGNILDEISQSQADSKNLAYQIVQSQDDTKDLIFEKLDQSSEDIQRAVSNKIIEIQEESKDNILNEIIDVNEKNKASMLYGVKDCVSTASENLHSTIEESVLGLKTEISGQIDNSISQITEKQSENSEILSTITGNQEKSKGLLNHVAQKQQEAGAVLDEMSQRQVEARDLVENVAIVQKEIPLSLSEISQSQEDTKNLANQIVQNQTETKDLLFEKLEQTGENIKHTVANKIIELQEESKDNILNEIIEVNEKNKASMMYGLKESISGAKAELSEKINSLGNDLLSSQSELQNVVQEGISQDLNEVSDSIVQIVEKQSENGELLNEVVLNQKKNKMLISQSQEETKEFISVKMDESTQEIQQNVVNKILEIQEKTENNLINDIVDENEKTKASLLYGLRETVANVKVELSEQINSLGADLLSSQNGLQNEVQEAVSQELSEVSDSIVQIVEKQLENGELLNEVVQNQERNKTLISQSHEDTKDFISVKLDESSEDIQRTVANKILETQEDAKNNILSEIIDENEKTKASVLYGIKENVSNATTSINSEIEGNVLNAKTELAEKLNVVEGNLLSSQSELKTAVLDEFSQGLDELNNSVSQITEKQSENGELLNEVVQNQEENRLAILDNIAESQNDVKTAIIDKISKLNYDTETMILNELEANIQTIKEVLVTLSEKEDEDEDSDQIEELKSTIQEISESIGNKIQESEENYKTSTQSLLSDVKVSFYEKVDDGLDGLKSFMEVFGNKIDVSHLIDNLKLDVFEKINEISGNIEFAISNVSVKDELYDVSNEIGDSIDSLFEKIKDEIVLSLEDCESIKNISEKSEEVQRSVESLKSSVVQDISEKMDEFELSASVQRKETSELIESVKTSIDELKENYVDLSLNSNMEISSLLLSMKDEIEGVQEKFNNINFDSAVEASTAELKQEFEVINQKLDLLAMDSDSESEQSFNEIKQILNSQDSFIKKLDNIEKLDSMPQLTDLQNMKNGLHSVLKSFETKLNTLVSVSENDASVKGENVDVKAELNTFKEEIVENLIEIFNQISFVEETEDIKDFVEEKIEEVKLTIKDIKINNQDDSSHDLSSLFDDNLENVLSCLDSLHEKTTSVDTNCFDIKKDIEQVKEHLLASSVSLDEDADYSYTLQDIESDIAKVRLILKDISESKSGGGPSGDLGKLTEDITSISTRTNKLLLNSDESYTALRDNLQDLKGVVFQFDKKVKDLDNKEPINKIDKKLDALTNMMLSSVQSDKIFNQTFMYLAEWIDKADDKISNIETNMIKKSDLESMFEKFVKKIDKQQDKIKSLEDKINKLSSKKETAAKQTDIKTIINEALSKIEMPIGKADTKLAKKVDGIDKQLMMLGKNIEKITSYVD